MRELIRADEKRQAEEQLEGLLLEGLKGDAKALTVDDGQAIREVAAARARRRGRAAANP